MQETRVRSLGWEDPLEKEMATHSSVLTWRIPGTGEPGGLPSIGSHGVVPGASVRNPTHDKVMRKEADIRKACSDFRDPSGNS